MAGDSDMILVGTATWSLSVFLLLWPLSYRPIERRRQTPSPQMDNMKDHLRQTCHEFLTAYFFETLGSQSYFSNTAHLGDHDIQFWSMSESLGSGNSHGLVHKAQDTKSQNMMSIRSVFMLHLKRLVLLLWHSTTCTYFMCFSLLHMHGCLLC